MKLPVLVPILLTARSSRISTRTTMTKTSAPTDPLRDTTKLVDAATKQAQRVLDEHKKGKGETMTAMEFCRMVLDEGLGLKDWAVGQRQRIVISKARKETLGKLDKKVIVSPPKAEPLELPSTSEAYKQLSDALSSKDDANKKNVESELDVEVLKEKGIVHLPGVLSTKEVLEILEYVSKKEDGNRLDWTLLRPTTGNGQGGAYATLENLPECLQKLQEDIQNTLQSKMGVESGNKTIFLKMGSGAVNWAHQDQSSCPYQAMVMLSRPKIDYNGGKLYVCDPSSNTDGNKILSHEVEYESSGDLAIFSANDNNATGRPFYHGMTKVLPGESGDEKDCHRLAIGMLQT